MDAVREVLEEIGAGDVPELLVFNKADQGDGSERLAEKYEGSVAVSAHSGFNLEHLTAVIGDRVRSMTALAELMIPWDRGDVLASVHREGQVLSERAEEHGMRLKARLEPASLGHLHEYVLTVDGEVPSQQRHEEDEW
jgi:GTP-binding protein HflX